MQRETGFDAPASPRDTDRLFGRQGGRGGGDPPGFTPRDPPVREFLAGRDQIKKEWQFNNQFRERADGNEVSRSMGSFCKPTYM